MSSDPIPCIIESPRELAFALCTDAGVFKVYTISYKWGTQPEHNRFSIIAFGPSVTEALRSVPELWWNIRLKMAGDMFPPKASRYKLDTPQGRAAARRATMKRLGLPHGAN